MNALRNLIAAAALGLAALPSFAVTDCPTLINVVYVGDAGIVYIGAATAPNFYFNASDPNAKNALAMASLAMALGKTVTARYSANGVSCVAGPERSDAIGMFVFN